MYNYKDVLKKSIEYFGDNELSGKVWLDKYSLKDNNENLLEQTPDDMHHRICSEIVRVEKKKFKTPLTYEQISPYIYNFSAIIPQGSPMFGIGNKYQYTTLSNCYVLTSPKDNYSSIIDTDKELVNIAKRRGGNGIDLTHLRPAGSPTQNAARTSTGVVSFAERYSNSTREVGQNARRGALMLTLDVHHPECIKITDDDSEVIINEGMERFGVRPIKTKKRFFNPHDLDFCSMKLDRTKVTGANVSIKFTNEFLDAVDKKTEYEQRWPINSKTPKIRKMVDAVKAWEKVVHCSWQSAEPGILFWDNIINESPADCYYSLGYSTEATNPCGELPLCRHDSCRLLAMNLLYFVVNAFKENAYFDFKKFVEVVKIAQRIMDDIIDLELEAIERIIEKLKSDEDVDSLKDELNLWNNIWTKCKNGRRTGLGITALGDTIAALGIKYGSEESVSITGEIYKALKLAAYESSVDIAEELGSFNVWDYKLEKDNPFLNRFKQEKVVFNGETIIDGKQLYERMKVAGRRNIALLTTAPTGTTSLLTRASFADDKTYGTSSGIEPVYMLSHKRRRKCHSENKQNAVFVDSLGDGWEEYDVYHPTVHYWKKQTGLDDITKSPWYGACAMDIDWINRVKLQAAAQRHVDHSISATVNLPEDVSEEMIGKIFLTAWKHGLKGITIYRDNCRTGILSEKSLVKEDEIRKTHAPKRPKELPCDVHHISVKGKKYFVLVGLLNGQPYEVFAGKNNGAFDSFETGKLIKVKKGYYKADFGEDNQIAPISLASDEHEECINRLTSVSLRHGADIQFIVEQLGKVNGEMNSFAKCVARALKKYIKDGSKCREKCEKCGSEDVVYQEGCKICKVCANSKCN